MPTWGVHLSVATNLIKEIEKVKKVTQKEKNEFLFGNILPDVNNGYVIKNVSNIIPHKITHFEDKEFKGTYSDKPGYINFYEKYKEELNNPVILGYYTHLMTDYYFNTITYKQYGIFDEKNNRIGVKLNNGTNLIIGGDEPRRMKANDFKIYSYYLYNNADVQMPKYDENILENVKLVKNIKLEQEDIYKSTKYLAECMNKPEIIFNMAEDKEYKIYTESELKKTEEQCIEFIMKNLE